MEIIEHQDPFFRKSRKLVDQQRQSNFPSIALGRLEQIQCFFPQPRLEGLQRTNYIAEKAAEIVIVAVEGQPGNGEIGFSRPFDQEIGFSKAGRRSEQRQWAFDAALD